MVWKRGVISVKGYWKSPVLGSAGRKQSPDQGTDVTCRFCGTFVLTILQIRKRRSTCCLGQSFVSSGDCLFYSELQTHEIADNLHCLLYSVALACTHPIHPCVTCHLLLWSLQQQGLLSVPHPHCTHTSTPESPQTVSGLLLPHLKHDAS